VAKILLGATLADARGSVGGATYTKGRFGAVLRIKVSPVQPRTGRVLTVRGLFSTLAKRWANTLTDAQRAGWNSLAAANPRTNVFGNSITLTGLQLYESANRNLQIVGQAVIDAAPANFDITNLLTITPAAAAGAATFSVPFTATPLGADDYIVVHASGPFNAGRSFFGSKLKQIFVGAAASASPANIHAAYIALFGALRATNKIQVRAFVIRDTNGAASTPLSSDVIVAA
jgi:hypothetical protein